MSIHLDGQTYTPVSISSSWAEGGWSNPVCSSASQPDISDPLCFTLLQAPPGRPQRKRIDIYSSTHAIPPLVWGVHYFRCEHPSQLGIWLKRLENEPSMILLRGAPQTRHVQFLSDPDALEPAKADIERSWSFAQPIYRDLSTTRRALKQLERDQMGGPSQTQQKLEAQIEDYFEALNAIGWVARRKQIFSEVARQWVWLDLDQGLDLHESLPLNDHTDHQAALRWIVQTGLPEAFHEVSFVGQWSSSAFMNGRKVKAHFAFMFDQPLGEGALKAWHGVRGQRHWPLKWDVATFRTVQPHYTAAPKFVGVSSPVSERTFWVNGLRDFVHIDHLSLMKLNAQGRSVVPQSPEQDSSTPLQVRPTRAQSSCAETPQASSEAKENSSQHRPPPTSIVEEPNPPLASVPSTQPLDGSEAPEVLRVLAAQIERLTHSEEGQRNQVLYRCACILGRYVGGKQLSSQRLIKGLLRGAKACGLLDKVGKVECLRQIHNGIRWGVRRPISEITLDDALSLKSSSYTPRLLDELRLAIDNAILQPQSVPVIALTCGGGKTTALCALMAEDVSAGATRIVLCRNHEMAQAFKEGVEAYAARHSLVLEKPVKLIEGMQRHCAILKKATPKQRRALHAALAYGRQALCGRGSSRCEYAQSCEGAKRPRAIKGGLTIATHAMGPLLDFPDEAVVLIDELPTPVTTQKVTIEDLKIFIEEPEQEALPLLGTWDHWRVKYPEVRIAARAVRGVMQWLAHAPNLVEQDYGQTLDPEEALLIFQEAFEALVHLQDLELSPMPLPSPTGARRGIWPQFPQRGVLEVILELARQIPDGLWPSALSVHWRNQDVWIEVRELYSLPNAPLVCLDGTAHRTEKVWSALALHSLEYPQTEEGVDQYLTTGAYSLNRRPQAAEKQIDEDEGHASNLMENHATLHVDEYQDSSRDQSETISTSKHRNAQIWSVAAVGEAPLFARWVKTQQLRTSQLIRRDVHLMIHWRKRALGSLRRCAFTIERAARDAGMSSEQSIGILAAKHVADLFRVAFEQETTPQFSLRSPLVLELIEALRAALGTRKLVIGHVGAHDIGSNLYHGVDLLAMLGSSKPDWGATLADLRALGIAESDCHGVYSQLVSARDVQGLARARHLRRAGVALLYIGDMPPPVGHDLPDVRWEEVEPAHPNPSQKQQSTQDECSALLLTHGYVTVPMLRTHVGLSRAKAVAMCHRLVRQHDLVEWSQKIGGRGRSAKAFGFPDLKEPLLP